MEIGTLNKLYLYLGNEYKSPVIEYRYELDVPVEEKRLREAVYKTLERFPFFSQKPYLDADGLLVMKKNDGEAPVFMEEKSFLHLGSAETNGYLFCVTTAGNTVSVCASHALADGRGVNFFANLMIRNYLAASGYDMDGVELPYSESDDREGDVTQLLLDACAKVDAVPDEKVYHPENVFVIPEEPVYCSSPTSRNMSITWKNGDFLRVIHERKVTPASFVTALISEAIMRIYDTGDRTVVADVPVDLRAIMGSIAQSNFSSNVLLPYKPEYKDMTMREKAERIAESLKAQTTKNNMAYGMNAAAPMLDMLTKQPLDGGDVLGKLLGGQDAPARRTYLLSNIGSVRFPEKMDRHIKDFSLRAPNLEASPAYGLLTYRDSGALLIQQNYEDIRIPQAVSASLRKYGVDNELSPAGVVQCHSVSPKLFDKA